MSTLPQACSKGSKYVLGDKSYCYNIGMQDPLIREMVIIGIVNHDDGVYYTSDKNLWIREDNIFRTRKEAYNHLIKQAESEMIEP